MSKRLRCGVIGVGMGQGHIKGYQSHPGAEMVAVADVNPERLKTVADTFGVANRYTDALAMLKREKLDVVSIATPNTFHMPLALAAFKAGCHVLCEKPMAMNAQQGARMVVAAKQARRRLMIDFSYRFTEQASALKRQVDTGILGEVYFARSVWHRRRGLPGFGGWFGVKKLSGGGPLIDLGVHRLDLALWLMGYPEPEWVMGGAWSPIGSRLAREEKKAFDCEDLACGMIRFKNGAMLELEASWAANIAERELMETRLLGTKAGLVQRNRNEGYDFEAEIYLERDGAQYDMKLHPPVKGVPSAYHHFIDSILSGKPHLAPGEEGLMVMRILDAIYASAARKRPMRIG